MWTPKWVVIGVVLLSDLIQSTTASLCTNQYGLLRIFSQKDIDDSLVGCTSWNGSIQINSGSGSRFVLSNITNITGSLNTAYGEELLLLTSIEAPELRFAGEIHLSNASSLYQIHFPKLEAVEYFSVQLNLNVEALIDLSSLVNATSFVLFGNIPRVSLPSLVDVAGSLAIGSNRSLLDVRDYEDLKSYPGISLSFPVLAQAGAVQLLGNINRIEMPLLATVVMRTYDFYAGRYAPKVKIWTSGSPLEVSLPSLWNTSDIDLSGTLSMFSFPALTTMSGILSVNSAIKMHYNLTRLENAREIRFSGAVKEYNVDSLLSVDSLVIKSNDPVNCNPAKDVFQRIYPGYGTRKWYESSPMRMIIYSCNDIPRNKSKPFPKVAVGLSVGIGIPVWVFFVFALWHSRKAKKEAEEFAKISPPDYEAEMAARSAGGGEVLPDYEPRRSQGSEEDPGSLIELVDMTRPSPHPPGYDTAIAASSSAVPTGEGPADANVRSVGDSVDANLGRAAGNDGPRPGVTS